MADKETETDEEKYGEIGIDGMYIKLRAFDKEAFDLVVRREHKKERIAVLALLDAKIEEAELWGFLKVEDTLRELRAEIVGPNCRARKAILEGLK